MILNDATFFILTRFEDHKPCCWCNNVELTIREYDGEFVRNGGK